MLRDLFSLFPAYAGVIPKAICMYVAQTAFPRIRGGDPFNSTEAMKNRELFPAYAGVILDDFLMLAGGIAFPRIRGGDPSCLHSAKNRASFSPHTRG